MATNVFRVVLPCMSQIIFRRKVLNLEYLLIKRALRITRTISSSFVCNRYYSSSDGQKNKNTLLEKYFAAKEASEVEMPPLDVDPHGVFANNELDLGDIEVYGFDYDYTLAVYKESLHYLIYDLGRDWLLNKFKYPKEIEQLDYRPGFAIRGLHYDIQKGLLMKIDSFHQIQFGSVYRGLTTLSNEEVTRIYGGTYIPQNLIRGTESEPSQMKQLNDLFTVPEICLLSNVTEYFEKHNIAYHPEILFNDIQNAVRSIHPVIHDKLDEDCIEIGAVHFTIDRVDDNGNYLEKNEELPSFLQRLVKAGKKMFLVTNSPFKFVHHGMVYMIGTNWQELFDVIVVQARKPKFFTDQSRPFRIYDPITKSQLWERVTTLEKGKVYIEGTLKQLQEMTGWRGSSVLYFGDQIYSDLADLTLHHGWKTGAIIDELRSEIKILNSEEFRHAVSWLQTLQHLVEEMQDHEDAEEIIEELLEERDQLRITTKSLFNAQFGSIFRTHHNPTYFSRRLFRYSDIYMSHVTNLLNYTLKHTFYPRRGALPHECKIPYM